MNITECQQRIRRELQAIYSPRESANVTDILLEHFTGLKRIDRLMYSNHELTATENEAIQEAVTMLLQHKPIQYITGYTWFYGLKFVVNSATLIPRPETEELVDWIVNDCKETDPNFTGAVLDIGTGTGCLPISIKYALKHADVYAIDISDDALSVARSNAKVLNTPVTFFKHDILQPSLPETIPALDIIVSNPPYIPEGGKKEMQKNVLDYEPAQALFVPDEDPLLFYEAIARQAQQRLRRGGFVYAELHEDLAEKTKTLFEQKGFINVFIKEDMQGKQRMLKAQWPVD